MTPPNQPPPNDEDEETDEDVAELEEASKFWDDPGVKAFIAEMERAETGDDEEQQQQQQENNGNDESKRE